MEAEYHTLFVFIAVAGLFFINALRWDLKTYHFRKFGINTKATVIHYHEEKADAGKIFIAEVQFANEDGEVVNEKLDNGGSWRYNLGTEIPIVYVLNKDGYKVTLNKYFLLVGLPMLLYALGAINSILVILMSIDMFWIDL